MWSRLRRREGEAHTYPPTTTNLRRTLWGRRGPPGAAECTHAERKMEITAAHWLVARGSATARLASRATVQTAPCSEKTAIQHPTAKSQNQINSPHLAPLVSDIHHHTGRTSNYIVEMPADLPHLAPAGEQQPGDSRGVFRVAWPCRTGVREL